jgi:homoserine dehydrogenase
MITSSEARFFSGSYDVVIEVMGGVEPAATRVARALDARIPVVTANKSLLAAHGERLSALAAARRTSLLFEASVVAGVPFLEGLARRPLAGSIDRIEAILNGTSNYILTRMADDQLPFEAALAEAQALGYAEPDPAHDITGRDAAEKLCILLRQLRIARLQPDAIPTVPIARITGSDLSRARARGGDLKPIARARTTETGLEVFVGPEFVPRDHPLGRVRGVENGVLLESRFAGRLFFTGQGAGPDVTAATILDDVITIAESLAPRRADVAWRTVSPTV